MAQVLRQLPPMVHGDLLAGAAYAEDAGVYRLRADLAIVLTTDFFPPLVDDPQTFGRIAAANALSDVYAMGGRPVTALNLVCFPDDKLDLDILGEILRGGAEKVLEAGAVVAGGHSVRDAEIKYGLAVTGTIHPDQIIRNHGARPGDALILTKPIGSGVLTTAAKKGLIDEAALAEAIAVMTTLNRRAAEAMVEVGVHAATDITGYGLLGHAFEMADASETTLVFDTARVALMAGVRDLARQGCVTRAHRSTLSRLGPALDASGIEAALVHVLADAQTSGGLLISVAADRADELVRRCGVEAGVAPPTVVGEVRPASAVRLSLK